jgi:hypothetical protein
VRVRDTEPLETVERIAAEAAQYKIDYVGIDLTVDGMAVQCDSGDPVRFCRVRGRGAQRQPGRADPGRGGCGPRSSPGWTPRQAPPRCSMPPTPGNWQALASLAQRNKTPLAVRGATLDELAQLSTKLQAAGVQELVLDPGARGFGPTLTAMTQLRRLALKGAVRELGFPAHGVFPGEGLADPADEAALAAQQIAKYAGFVVLDHFSTGAGSIRCWCCARTSSPTRRSRSRCSRDCMRSTTLQARCAADGDDQLLDHLLQRGQRGRQFGAMPGWLLVADAEGHERADGLGRRQVRRRGQSPRGSRAPASPTSSATAASSSPARSRCSPANWRRSCRDGRSRSARARRSICRGYLKVTGRLEIAHWPLEIERFVILTVAKNLDVAQSVIEQRRIWL